MFLNLYHFNLFEAYNIVDNNETSNYLTHYIAFNASNYLTHYIAFNASNYLSHYIAFNASNYDPDSREQTVELIYSVSAYNNQVCWLL